MSERPIPEPLCEGLIHYEFPCVELLNSFSLVEHRLGMTDTVIQSKEQWVLHRLEAFYANPTTFARVQAILQGESKLSLRLIDWFVTNYSCNNWRCSYNFYSNIYSWINYRNVFNITNYCFWINKWNCIYL